MISADKQASDTVHRQHKQQTKGEKDHFKQSITSFDSPAVTKTV